MSRSLDLDEEDTMRRRHLGAFLWTIVVIALGAGPAVAAVLHVPGDYGTIQAAITAAAPGDTVLVAPALYSERLTLNKAITLASHFLSTGDRAHIDQTVIDAAGGTAAITITSGVSPMPVVQGFTIRGGSDGIAATSKFQLLDNRVTGNGDGVDYQDSGGVARGNVIEGNSDDGLDLDGATALLIEDNIIQNNGDDGIEVRLHAYTGASLEIIIRGNIIEDNKEDGIQLIDYSGLSSRVFRIERNLISGNAMVGLGMMADENTVEDFSGAPLPEPVLLIHNTFVSHPYHATGGATLTARNNIFVGATAIALKNVAGSSTISHSLFWNNAADSQASNVDGGTAIIADPLLDATFHLLPGSPAIDAGTIVGLPYAGLTPDLGAYESEATAPPPAFATNAGPDQKGTVGVALSFTGSATGGIAPRTFAWDFGDGASATGPSVSHAYVASGAYTVILTATDSAGARATDAATITITAASPPRPSPPPPLSGQTLTFPPVADATVKLDEPTSNFGEVEYLEADADSREDFLIKFTLAGIGGPPSRAVLRLWAISSSQGGDFRRVTDQSWIETSVTWNTAPPAGDVVASLGLVSGGGVEVDVTPLIAGDGTVSLRVSNPSSSGTRYRSREASTPDQRPQLVVTTGGTAAPLVADAGPDHAASAERTLTFVGSATGGVAPYAFHWDLGDRASATGRTATHIYQAPGTYTVRLTVTDAAGARATDMAQARVAVQPLAAGAGPDKTSAPGSPLGWSGAASGGVAPYTFTWSFGDGSSAAGQSVSHAYASAGTYTVSLTVTDARGTQASDTALAQVISGPQPPPPPPSSGGLRAFPGAEGFGAEAVGGRGGRVIAVTNLNDSGPGSLRAAIEATGPRTAVFRVGGTIELLTPLRIKNPFITIAGQTAPGGGIALRNHPSNRRAALAIDTSEVVVRYLRVRPGPSAHASSNVDALLIRSGSNIIIDHCSFSWAVDENVNTWYRASDITIQWSLISEALHRSTHSKGSHSMGMLVGHAGSHSISIHHNLFAHNDSRNPAIKTTGTVDFVNNVIHNYGDYAGWVGDEHARVPLNFVGNVYQSGPDSDPARWELEVYEGYGTGHGFSLHVRDNIGPHRLTGTEPQDAAVSPNGRAYIVASPNPAPPVTTIPAQDAFAAVLDGAGATLPARDAVDQRVVNAVRTRAGAIIDSPSQVGGWPDLASGAAPVDSDGDGMPDDWEHGRGLDPGRDDGAADRDGDGYTNLEEYLNSL
jgi:pectate lyase